MKRLLLTLVTLFAAGQMYSANAGVSVTVGQPGFYGQIDIGDFAPQPQVLYPQPVIIQQVPVYQRPAPIYLHVPPGHSKNWSRYCNRYQACGRPVYFVQDTWYRDEYAPRYREYREHDGRDYRHDDSHDYKRPPGKAKGHGKGHDKH